jgi:nucleotide-binding universal stress UspA family protein
MKKILLPLEDTERSLKAISYVCRNYKPEDTEVVLLMIDESLGYKHRPDLEAESMKALEEKLDFISESFDGYRIYKRTAAGKAGVRIVRAARETSADLIIMTKSSKDDMISKVGSTTEYVLSNSPCDVIIFSEAVNTGNEYRGLVYRTASAVVNLRGLLGDKQSECLLPSVNVDCIYHIDVTVGRIRFYHTAYNPDTRNWDRLPMDGQDVRKDISAGEACDILVKADSTDGKADRIRIVNADMKREAVFTYRISAAPAE